MLTQCGFFLWPGPPRFSTTYDYDKDTRPILVEFGEGSRKITYGYDGGESEDGAKLNRLLTRTVSNGNHSYSSEYSYAAGGGESPASYLVSKIEQAGMNLVYSYDNMGNILTVKQYEGETEPEEATVSYQYDLLGQLVRVNDKSDPTGGSGGTTWQYSYDLGGLRNGWLPLSE